MRLASVFAGQTRTNQPSCAAAPTGTPISSAIRVTIKNARICPPALLSRIELSAAHQEAAPGHPPDQDSYTTRKTAGLIQIKVRRHGSGTLITRSAGDKR